MSMPWSAGLAQSIAASAISSSVCVPVGVVEAHGAGEAPEQLGVGHRLADGGHRRHVERQVEMAPGEHDVELLELGRRRQHDVGIARGVGQELLADHGEQVVAREAAGDLGLLGRHDHRVRVVDEQRLDRRVELGLAGQNRAEPPLVDDPRARRQPVRAHEVLPFQREGPDRQLQHAAADLAPGADQGRQAGGARARSGRRRHGARSRRRCG